VRIAEIAPLAHPVPPPGEGSIETVVALLAEGLQALGHEVTLFATADSRASVRLLSPVETGYTADPNKWDWQLYETYQAREAFARARQFDVIHCHAYHFGLLFCDAAPTPSLHSLHVEPGPDTTFLLRRTRRRRVHCCSRFQAAALDGLPGVHVVPHGLDLSRYGVAEPAEREDYVAFLGRFTPDKGVLEAIDLCARAGLPLRLAAPVNDYYRQAVAPRVDGRRVQCAGELRGRDKAQFLARARALLYPIRRPEPFGLVLVEALASGLPVVAYDRGAVAEIIDHGRTGWLGREPEDLLTGLERVEKLDRQAVRREAEVRFSAERMIQDLEALLLHTIEAPEP